MSLDTVTANSVAYTATSIEAVALRIRVSLASGKGDCHQVLEWAQAELERLAGECAELAPEARSDECAEAAQ
jgi:hypothetical protein